MIASFIASIRYPVLIVSSAHTATSLVPHGLVETILTGRPPRPCLQRVIASCKQGLLPATGTGLELRCLERSWVQVSNFNAHFGEGGDGPVCYCPKASRRRRL